MTFSKDQDGKEILLKDGIFQVMMEWEKPYMEACIDALHPQGDVLEIGFGCGYASTHIQKYNPTKHTIIEYHPMIAEKARLWAKNYSNVEIIEDTWQNALNRLGSYNAIFFDDYPIDTEKNHHEEKIRIGSLVLEKGQETLAKVHEKIPELKSFVYQIKDLEEFFDTISKEKHTHTTMLRFLFDLKKTENITEETLQSSLKLLIEKKIATQNQIEEYIPNTNITLPQQEEDRFLPFLELCLKSHLKKEGVISCYLAKSCSKFQDDRFFQKVILNPSLEYQEKTISIDVPKHCNYYSDREALVITIKKMTDE